MSNVPRDASLSPAILGAGITGLAASWISGATAWEAEAEPGGICRSYTVEGYRFEVGGGHWIFGGDPVLNRFLEGLGPIRYYQRRSSVWLSSIGTFVPYPLQYNLHALPLEIRTKAFAEMSAAPAERSGILGTWLLDTFGPTLFDLFFGPFHELYTAGELYRIAVQDAFKTPLDLRLVERGMDHAPPAVGYNSRFAYPVKGLDTLASSLARGGRIRTGSRVLGIDPIHHQVYLSNGMEVPYPFMVSTLPLDAMLHLTGLQVEAEPGIRTAVLVLNLGGRRGPQMPDDHWVYIPSSESGFHRVGFYSNVDTHFVPGGNPDRASLYVERAFPAGAQPSPGEIEAYGQCVARELVDWGWLGAVEVISPTWVENAYTWSAPGSTWREDAIRLLAESGILMTGRYGKWQFQGIADSLRDGFLAGASLRAAL